jgi:hypothetical protein
MTTPLCELRVFSRRHHYAGTLDVLGLWRNAGALIDYKTGDPRDVAADLQTAAYLGALLEMQANNDTAEMLTFDAATHRYTLDGVPLPSVTGILEWAHLIDFSRIPQDIRSAALTRGTAVHQACHYYNEGDLDVAGFEQDFPTYWPYLSAWITFRRDSGFVLEESLEHLGTLTHIKRYAVRLKKDATYRVEPYTDPRDFSKFATLVSAFHIAQAYKGAWIETLADVA